MRDARWAGVLLLAVACVPVVQLPSRGGAAWREVQSEHFTLWTSGSADRGRDLVREMERRREVIVTAMHNAESRTRTFVIGVVDPIELGRAAAATGRHWDAHNPIGQPGLVLEVNNADRNYLVSHAIARVLSREVVAHQPEWLSEGIAQYFGAFDLVPGRAYAEIGFPDGLAGQFPSPLATASVFGCMAGCSSRAFNATSWALFSMLLNDHHDRLTELLHRLDAVEDPDDWARTSKPLAAPSDTYEHPTIAMSPLNALNKDPDAELGDPDPQRRVREALAWRDTFPDLPPDKLDQVLRVWLSVGKTRLPRVPVTVRDVAITERPLSDADVLAMRGWLTFLFTQDAETSRRDADAALALDRTHVLARWTEAAVTHSISPEDARATAAAHPEDWRALHLVEAALRGTPEGDEARQRVCTMSGNAAPECPHARPSAPL